MTCTKARRLPGGAVLNFNDDGGVSVVTDGHAFAEIVCECHFGRFLKVYYWLIGHESPGWLEDFQAGEVLGIDQTG